MGIRDGLATTTASVKLALLIVFVAEVCSWVSYCTNFWGASSYQSYQINFGLRSSCDSVDGCRRLEATASNSECASPERILWSKKIVPVRAFAFFGFMSLNVGFLLIIFYVFCGSCRNSFEVSTAAAIFLFFSAASWLIPVAKMGDLFVQQPEVLNAALGLAVIGGMLMTFGAHGHRDENDCPESKLNRPSPPPSSADMYV